MSQPWRGAGGGGPAHSPMVSHTGDPLHHRCWNYSTASLGPARERLTANGQIALNHSGLNRLEMWPAEISRVDTDIAHHRSRTEMLVQRATQLWQDLEDPFHPGRHCVI